MSLLPFSIFKQGGHDYEVTDKAARSDISYLKKNAFSTPISVNPNTDYTCPNDGYFTAENRTVGGYANIQVNAGDSLFTITSGAPATSSGWSICGITVRKGQTIRGLGSHIYFIPYI